MAYLSDYTAGTVTVSGTTVTGVGTAWQVAQFREGDWFIADGWVGIVASVDSNTSATLVAWAGPDLTDAPYRMRYMSDGSRASAQARQLIDELGGSGNLQALGGLTGAADELIMFTGPGTMTTVNRAELVSGVAFDVQVDTLAERAVYDDEVVGFTVLVSDNGDGRSALYTRVGSSGWSEPAFITGPAVTLDITEVDEVPYGTEPDVTLTPVAGGYDLAFEIPRGMIIEPGTTTTLAPDQPAAVNFVPITGGFRLDIAIPRGPTGDINGVTPFWTTRLGSDTNAAAARAGLGAISSTEPSFNLDANTPRLAFRKEGQTQTDLLIINDNEFQIRVFGPDGGSIRNLVARFADSSLTWAGNEVLTAASAIAAAQIPASLTPDKAYRRGNILGPVSQSSGVPTGAIIERGSNANGNYVKFADGTQICWRPRFQMNGPSLYGWDFPAPFLDVDSYNVMTEFEIGSASDANIFGGHMVYSASTGTYTNVRASVPDIVFARMMAIGRWF